MLPFPVLDFPQSQNSPILALKTIKVSPVIFNQSIMPYYFEISRHLIALKGLFGHVCVQYVYLYRIVCKIVLTQV